MISDKKASTNDNLQKGPFEVKMSDGSEKVIID